MPDDNQEDHDIDEEGLDIDQYEDDLNEQMNDGGGCNEAWSSLTEIRNNTESKVNRRSTIKTVLATLGIGVVGTPGLTEPAAATSENSDSLNVQRVVESKEEDKIIFEKVSSNPDFQKIHRHLIDRGFDRTSVKSYESISESEDFNTICVKYEQKSKTASILWTDWDEFDTRGLVQSETNIHTITVPDDLSEDTENDVEVSPSVDLPDIPGCPGTDYSCLQTTIIVNGIPATACSTCLADIATGNDTGACTTCLNSLGPGIAQPCTICTGE
ncbi:hypothetical protein [Halorubrum sp. Atlit-28R]|uniref:hypothetical protein n=1 Tax=Halorubrum sp. Atlit-28R TaxID=2282129 RepID=UPI0011C3F58F|nr:hypothetical protein [Halorubrum sp. Atlit-28R]